MENKFFTFIKPYLSFIDNGSLFRKPVSWLYTFFAVFSLIIPIIIFYKAADNNIFDAPTKFVIAFLLVWIIIAFTSWISFQLLWDRKSKIINSSREGDEFVATPVFSHLIQTFGECIGTCIGIGGFGTVFLTTLILGDEGDYLLDEFYMETGLGFMILMPICGFLIIVTTRFLAEQFRALSSIANNTRKE